MDSWESDDTISCGCLIVFVAIFIFCLISNDNEETTKCQNDKESCSISKLCDVYNECDKLDSFKAEVKARRHKGKDEGIGRINVINGRYDYGPSVGGLSGFGSRY